MNELPKLIAVVGTTASGKSELALDLAKEFDGEIVSVDSRQIYKEMDIGTNKEPGEKAEKIKSLKDKKAIEIEQKLEEMESPLSLEQALSEPYIVEGIPHYMISVVRPDELLTLSHFQQLAFGIIDDILYRGKLPILVGGTALYTSAIIENWQIPEARPDPNLRSELEAMTDEELIRRLDSVDAKRTKTIDLKNRRRLIRAIEIAEQGKVVKSPRKLEKKYDALCLAPCVPFGGGSHPPAPLRSTGSGQALQKRGGEECVDRGLLYQRINERVDRMIEEGLVDEVKYVGEKYGYDVVAMTGHAYQQIGKYLQGEWSLEQAIEESKKVTRHYAKRQLTWWRKYGNVFWMKNFLGVREQVAAFLKV